MARIQGELAKREIVSMESGLEGRNNSSSFLASCRAWSVSMESGLEGRNNKNPTAAMRKHAA